MSSGPDVWGYEVISNPRPRALSVAAVRPELDMLYRQMHEQNRGEGPQRVCHELNVLDLDIFTLPLSHSSLPVHMCLITGFPVPQDQTLFGLSPGPHNQHDLSSYNQLSHHAFQHYQLGGIPECHSVKSDSGLLRGQPLWDMDNLVQPTGTFSGNQTASSQTGEAIVWKNKFFHYLLLDKQEL